MKLITGYGGNQLAILELKGYDEETGTVREIIKSIMSLNDVLKYIKDNNSFNIQIANVQIDELRTGKRGRSKKTVRCFRLPICKLYEAVREEEVEQYVGIGNTVQTPYSYIGWKTVEYLDLAHVFIIEHYGMEGKDVFWYDKTGNKTSNKRSAIFSTKYDAVEKLSHCAKYDGLAHVKEEYIEI